MLTLRNPLSAVPVTRSAPTPSLRKPHKTKGFTIVELLIVIIVIAILAAITIVSYNGIQTRSNNTAIISAASQTLKMIQAYIAVNGTYPTATAEACVTSTSGCKDASVTYTANTTFDTNIASVGNVPRSIPTAGASAYGIRYNYSATRTYNGAVMPVVIQYFLLGSSQQCGIANSTSGTWAVTVTSSTGYYNTGTYDGIAKTQCIISVPGPTS